MAVEISMKEHDDWMQRRNNERFEKLKAKCCKNKKHAQPDLHQPTHPTKMDLNLKKAVEEDDVKHFIDTLEQVPEGLCLCTIFDHQVSLLGNSLLHEAAKFGSLKITKLIINHFPHFLTKQNFIRDTILHVALKAKKIKKIEALADTFRFGEQKHEGSSERPSSAYDHKELFQMKNHIGNTALHEAVRTGQSNEVIMYLLSVNPEALYSLNNEGQSPFFLAVETDNKDIRKLLLQATESNGDLEGRPREELPVYVAILRKRKGTTGFFFINLDATLFYLLF
jgi:ankyrin repeat protein